MHPRAAEVATKGGYLTKSCLRLLWQQERRGAPSIPADRWQWLPSVYPNHLDCKLLVSRQEVANCFQYAAPRLSPTSFFSHLLGMDLSAILPRKARVQPTHGVFVLCISFSAGNTFVYALSDHAVCNMVALSLCRNNAALHPRAREGAWCTEGRCTNEVQWGGDGEPHALLCGCGCSLLWDVTRYVMSGCGARLRRHTLSVVLR